MELKIKTNRELQAEDIRILSEIDGKIFSGKQPVYYGSPWNEKQWENTLKIDKVLLLSYNEIPAGFLVYSLPEEDLISLDKIVILEKFRGQKLGKYLMNYLLSFAEQKSFKRILLETPVNNLPAIHFYRKFGFKKIYIRKNYYPNGENALIMESFL